MLGSESVCQLDGWKIAPHCCPTQQETLPFLLPQGSTIQGSGPGLRGHISGGFHSCHILVESGYDTPFLPGLFKFKANDITNARQVFGTGTPLLVLLPFAHQEGACITHSPTADDTRPLLGSFPLLPTPPVP